MKTLKIIAPTWNDEVDSPDGSYSVLDIQDYIEYIIKKQEESPSNILFHIYINRINKRLVFKIKDRYKLNQYLRHNLGYKQKIQVI